MSAPQSPTRLFVCEGCQATLPYDAERVGKKCRCGRCGKILIMPGLQKKKAKSKPPQQFSFACRVCQTQLAAYVEDVGSKVECPDCGMRTVVPSPPKPRPKQVPKAMHGEQYGVWGVDEAPLPSEIAAHQPKFFAVFCQVCNTLMHARPEQVGKQIRCPDCHAKTIVTEPKQTKEKPSALVPDGEEYQLDESQAPIQRPIPQPPAIRDSESRKQYRDSLVSDYGERAELPRMPLINGVLPMLFRKPIPAWWLALSCVAALITFLASIPHPLVAIFGLVIAAVVGGVGFAGAAALCCAILTDSSEGNDRLHNTPSFAPHEWYAEAFYLGIAIAVSMIPGVALGKFLPEPALGVAIGMLICFPMILLSSLEQGSPLAVLSPRLLASLYRRPLHWSVFYVVSGLLLAGAGWAVIALLGVSPIVGVLAAPLAMAAVLLYFRLLGRFAWWLAESLPEAVEEQ